MLYLFICHLEESYLVAAVFFNASRLYPRIVKACGFLAGEVVREIYEVVLDVGGGGQACFDLFFCNRSIAPDHLFGDLLLLLTFILLMDYILCRADLPPQTFTHPLHHMRLLRLHSRFRLQ